MWWETERLKEDGMMDYKWILKEGQIGMKGNEEDEDGGVCGRQTDE